MKIKTVFFLSVITCFATFFLKPISLKAQQFFFTENFETDTLNNNWQKVNSNWYITAPDTLTVTKGKNIGRRVLKCDSASYIMLMVDIDTTKTRLLQLNFLYYAQPKGPAAVVEIDFMRKGYKDGQKGKWIKKGLPVKGAWATFQKMLVVPAEANNIWLTFSQEEKTKSKGFIYIDNITMKDID